MLATVSWMRVSSSGVSASSGCSGAAEGFSAGTLCQGLSANPAQTPRARDSTKHARVSRMSRFFCMDPPPFCGMLIFILPHFADPVCPFLQKSLHGSFVSSTSAKKRHLLSEMPHFCWLTPARAGRKACAGSWRRLRRWWRQRLCRQGARWWRGCPGRRGRAHRSGSK